MKNDLYKSVADKIIAELATGAAPWVKRWSATPGQNVPGNAVTGRPYSGVNVLLLWIARCEGWPTPKFLTLKQAKAAGGEVRSDEIERGTLVYFVKKLTVKDKRASAAEDDKREIMMLREYTVYNVAQCDGLPERIAKPTAGAPRNNEERDATIDEFVAATKVPVFHGGDRAFYAPGPDRVQMPEFADFNGAAQYYATLFHELGHATGHKDRLDRFKAFAGRFGDKVYAAEELVAELTSAFLCAEFSIDGDIRYAGYIQTWIELLKDDPKAMFTAASKAQQAATYLRQQALAEVPLAA